MTRFPVIITIGAGLLGWVAGEMALSDPAISGWAGAHHTLHTVAPIAGAVLVVAVGKWQAKAAALATVHAHHLSRAAD